MRALVVNCSVDETRNGLRAFYNLGSHKLANWLATQGYAVTRVDGDPGMFAPGYDLVCLSSIFSWHVPTAVDIALRVRDQSEVWVGGPGFHKTAKWFTEQTGIPVPVNASGEHGAPDPRFDRQRGNYKMTFAARGCPVGCSFCIVPKIEGSAFTFDPNFSLAPTLCDNNLSALPVQWQEHILRRYRESTVPLLEANSGFEPKPFDEATFSRWRKVLRGPWRFAFDELVESEDVKRMMRILRDIRARMKRVYVLLGNEPPEACIERIRKVIEWGGEPYCQVIRPLNALRRDDVRLGKTWPSVQFAFDLKRYWNSPQFWRTMTMAEYKIRGTHPLAEFARRMAA